MNHQILQYLVATCCTRCTPTEYSARLLIVVLWKLEHTYANIQLKMVSVAKHSVARWFIIYGVREMVRNLPRFTLADFLHWVCRTCSHLLYPSSTIFSQVPLALTPYARSLPPLSLAGHCLRRSRWSGSETECNQRWRVRTSTSVHTISTYVDWSERAPHMQSSTHDLFIGACTVNYMHCPMHKH